MMTSTDLFEIEEKCEGKTIFTLSANEIGVIMRFTDGSKLTILDGSVELIEPKEKE